ncbi:hypothetical protein PRVXT_002258 [Proteinivorax tanatarense]|uniref:FRG domain-containing protein n=1 Tax=Proteinivorax tanatarense TaxID=1260629 RepID=A0AAU7VJJ0_9FIRM
MELIIYGKGNKQLDEILPYLQNKNFLDYPQEIIEKALVQKILVKKNNKTFPGEKLIYYNLEEIEGLEEHSENYVHIIKKHIKTLKEKFNKSYLSNNGFLWDELQQMLIFAMCLDLSILTYLHKEKIIEESNGDYYIWAFDESIKRNNPFGIKLWHNDESEIALGELWYRNDKESEFNFKNQDLNILKKIINGEKDFNQYESKKLIIFKYNGIVNKENGEYRVNIPVFDLSNKDNLITFIEKISQDIINEVTLPLLEKLQDKTSIYKHGIVRLLMEMTADILIENKIIYPFTYINKIHQKNWIFTNLNKNIVL